MKYDIRIVNANIIDGTGKKAFAGEVGIKDGFIRKVDRTVSGEAAAEIDAKGDALSPGFIDLHTHCAQDISINYLQQGVTTVLSGNCGFGYGRISTRITDIKGKAQDGKIPVMGPNFALLAGHNTIRMMVMNRDNRAPSRSEMEKMKKIVREQVKEGAFGFSTGLSYVPGAYSRTEEIIELTKELRGTKGFYCSHMRNEGAGVVESVEEMLEIEKGAQAPVHISHHKVCGIKNWGKKPQNHIIDKKARKEGIDITLDQYPYTASCGTIQLLMPTYAGEGGPEEIRARLRDRRKEILEDVLEKLDNYYGNDLSRIVFVNCQPHPSLSGKTLADAAKLYGRKPDAAGGAETALDIIQANPVHGATMMVSHSMSEEEVEYIMKYPETCVASDGWTVPLNSGHPHPRLYGTFPRVISFYSREKGILRIEDAVKRMTQLPALRMGLTDRGVIKEDTRADIAIWNPEKIKDKATYKKPHQYPAGIDYVMVNGQLTLKKGKATGNYAGMFLTRKDR